MNVNWIAVIGRVIVLALLCYFQRDHDARVMTILWFLALDHAAVRP